MRSRGVIKERVRGKVRGMEELSLEERGGEWCGK